VSPSCSAKGFEESQVAVFLADIEMAEHIGADAIGNASAARLGIGHEGNDAAGMFRGAPVVVRALPEPTLPAIKSRLARLKKLKVDLIDQ